jgi:hypothetical protein
LESFKRHLEPIWEVVVIIIKECDEVSLCHLDP